MLSCSFCFLTFDFDLTKEVCDMKSIKSYIRLLYKYLSPKWPQLVLLIILFIISIGLSLIIPQIIRNFIDSADGGSN